MQLRKDPLTRRRAEPTLSATFHGQPLRAARFSSRWHWERWLGWPSRSNAGSHSTTHTGSSPRSSPRSGGRAAMDWRSRTYAHRIRHDLESNTAAVHVLSVVDAIQVEEAEDEGPTFFLKLDSGELLVAIGGQFLRPVRQSGLPLEAVRDSRGRRVGVVPRPRGERVVPSLVKPPLSLATVRELGIASIRWRRFSRSLSKSCSGLSIVQTGKGPGHCWRCRGCESGGEPHRRGWRRLVRRGSAHRTRDRSGPRRRQGRRVGFVATSP